MLGKLRKTLRKTYDRIVLIVLFVISVLSIVATIIINARGIVIVTKYGVIAGASLCGIIQSCVFFLSILAVLVNYDIGLKSSLVAIGANVVIGSFTGIMTRNYGILPGVFNAVVSVFALILISRDLKKSERRSKIDTVTGLMNRSAFEELVSWEISKHHSGYVVYFTLNNLREINENLGHRFGDVVLKEVGERISRVIGEKNVVCKNDGAEYLILISEKNPVDIVQKVMDSVGSGLVITKDDIEINYFLTSSAGISSFPKDSEDTLTLLKYADIAMVDSKRRGTCKMAFYDSNIAEKLARRNDVERKTKEALSQDYFYLVYQPQFRLDGKKLRGFETLIRMKRPDGEVISPGEFIAIAEQTELIHQIDDYVLRRAMWEFGSIIRNSDEEAILSINVSSKGMAHKGFADNIKKIIADTDFPADHLEIELTEYSFSESEARTVENIRILKEIGVKIALDDFGTGYTSLAQLLKLPIDLLKIDKSLIDDIESSQQNKDFVDSIIYMGHLMNCEVISEGVETETQLDVLKTHKCDFVQGYVWSKPISYEKAAGML